MGFLPHCSFCAFPSVFMLSAQEGSLEHFFIRCWVPDLSLLTEKGFSEHVMSNDVLH